MTPVTPSSAPAATGPADSPWRPVGDGEWVGTAVSERFPVYTRGNAGEVYPAVYTPLSFSIAAAAGEQAMRNVLTTAGVFTRRELHGVPLTTGFAMGVFGGYAYINLSMQRTAAGRVPGGSPEDVDSSYLGVGEAPPHERRQGDRNLRASIAAVRYGLRTMRRTELPELADDQRTVDEYVRSQPDPATASDRELIESSRDPLNELFMALFERHLLVSGAAGTMMTLLMKMCEQRLGDANIAVQLMSGLGDVDSAAPSVALWGLGRRVRASSTLTAEFDAGVAGLLDRIRSRAADDAEAARFVDEFAAFVAEFGSRGPNEWDTAFDTWETDPALALVLVDRMRGADADHDPDLRRAQLAAERARVEAAALSRLRWPARSMFRRVLAAARLYSQSRERTKTTVVRAIHAARLRAHELDRRLIARSGGERGDLWFLVMDETDAYLADPASFRETIAERRRMHARLSERIPPFTFDGVLPPLDEWEWRDRQLEPVVAGDVMAGLPGCPGVARGRARVVTDPADPRGLEPGDVLVAPLTDPSWTPLFVPADAVVVDVGAVMSHAVIVSRELGIPCAVSVQDASRRIPDGALVEVDGNTGTVTIIDVPG